MSFSIIKQTNNKVTGFFVHSVMKISCDRMVKIPKENKKKLINDISFYFIQGSATTK